MRAIGAQFSTGTATNSALTTAAQCDQTEFLAVERELSSPYVAVTPAANSIHQLGQLAGKLPIGQLEREHHSTDVGLIVADDLLDGIERVTRSDIHISSQPLHAAELLARYFRATTSKVGETRMIKHFVSHLRRVDAQDVKARI